MDSLKTDKQKSLNAWITKSYGKFFKRWNTDHLICLLRNLYAGQEATASDWFKIGKGVLHGCSLLPCLFNLYAEYIMWNAKLDESQVGTKIAGRDTNNLKYADDTTVMKVNKEELKSLLMKVRVKKMA